MLAWIPQGPVQILLNDYTPWYKEKGSHGTISKAAGRDINEFETQFAHLKWVN